MSINKRTSRDLGFREAVETYLEPIYLARGFARTRADMDLITYESPRVMSAISHDGFTYEIDLTFSRKAELEQKYTLPTLLASVPECRHVNGAFEASTPDRMIKCVTAISRLLLQCAEPVMAGDDVAFQRMHEAARQASVAFTKRIVNEPIRAAAENAWRKREFARVQGLYQSIQSDLTAMEQLKLKYARGRDARNG